MDKPNTVKRWTSAPKINLKCWHDLVHTGTILVAWAFKIPDDFLYYWHV